MGENRINKIKGQVDSMNKTIIVDELLKAQMGIAQAVSKGIGILSSTDEYELRTIMRRLPAIIERIEKNGNYIVNSL